MTCERGSRNHLNHNAKVKDKKRQRHKKGKNKQTKTIHF